MTDNWLPSSLLGGGFVAPEQASWRAQELDSSERQIPTGRFPGSRFPWPVEIGAVSGTLPMMDHVVLALLGHAPFGPWEGSTESLSFIADQYGMDLEAGMGIDKVTRG